MMFENLLHTLEPRDVSDQLQGHARNRREQLALEVIQLLAAVDLLDGGRRESE